jgi:hypothetical protein
MKRDEHEMLIEYSEMTAFNFNSKEYQEVRQDFIECKETAQGFEWFVRNFVSRFKKMEA